MNRCCKAEKWTSQKGLADSIRKSFSFSMCPALYASMMSVMIVVGLAPMLMDSEPSERDNTSRVVEEQAEFPEEEARDLLSDLFKKLSYPIEERVSAYPRLGRFPASAV
jgi:hypothetical protein